MRPAFATPASLTLSSPSSAVRLCSRRHARVAASPAHRRTAMALKTEAEAPAQAKKVPTRTEELMTQVKDAGLAGVISYAGWELAFWTASVPVCVVGYRELTGHWPDFSNADDMKKLGGEAFAFVNLARFAVPLRISLALGTTPWIRANIVDAFLKKRDKAVCE